MSVDSEEDPMNARTGTTTNSTTTTSTSTNTTTLTHPLCDVCDIQPPEARSHITYTTSTAFDTLSFGRTTSIPVLHNSVLFIPHLLSPQECTQLIDDCESRVLHQDDSTASWLYGCEAASHKNLPFERHEIKDLSVKTQDFFQTILRTRLLPFVANELPPNVEQSIWEISGVVQKKNATLAAQDLKFSESEPTINRYTTGGSFVPHRDALALTLNVLLSDQFEGGGTQFWEEREKGVKESKEPTLCALPKIGVGVVFNGTVKHAGRAVTSGIRHLLVVSFSIVQQTADRPPLVLTTDFVEKRNSVRGEHSRARARLQKRLDKRRQDSLS